MLFFIKFEKVTLMGSIESQFNNIQNEITPRNFRTELENSGHSETESRLEEAVTSVGSYVSQRREPHGLWTPAKAFFPQDIIYVLGFGQLGSSAKLIVGAAGQINVLMYIETKTSFVFHKLCQRQRTYIRKSLYQMNQ